MPRLLHIFIALIMIAFAGAGAGIKACSCGEMSVKDRLTESEQVFLGRVVSRKKARVKREERVKVQFRIERVWKGRAGSYTSVFTGPTKDIWGDEYEDMCALHFDVGRSYVVFVRSGKQPAVDVCSGVRDFPDAEKVIRELSGDS